MSPAHLSVGARRDLGPRAGDRTLRAWGALLLSAGAAALAVTSFGIVSLPFALCAMALARDARRQSMRVTPVAAVAWWVSLIAAAISAIALLVIALDLGGLGSPDLGVEEAR